MRNIRLFLASFSVSLLILQCNTMNFPPVPNYSISIENYSIQFSINLTALVHMSAEKAANVLKTIKHDRRIYYDFQEFLDTKASLIPKDLLESVEAIRDQLLVTKIRFEDGLERYKDTVHPGEFDSWEKKYHEKFNAEFAESAINEFSEKGLGKIPTILNVDFFNKVTTLNNICGKGELRNNLFEVLLKNIQYVTSLDYTLMEILEEFLQKSVNKTESSKSIPNIKSEALNVYRNTVKLLKAHTEKVHQEFYNCASNTSDSIPRSSYFQLKAFQKYLFPTHQIAPGYPRPTEGCPTDCTRVHNIKGPNKIVCNEYYDSYIPKRIADDVCLLTKKCSNIYCPDRGTLSRVHMCINPYAENRYQFYAHNVTVNQKCSGKSTVLPFDRRHPKIGKHTRRTYNCPVCDCICADNDYYISTKLVAADVLDHKVIVGARFNMTQNTLYIEILQAQILTNGKINASTKSWKKPEDIMSYRVKLNWNEMRSLDLTETVVPKDRVVIGLLFTVRNQRIALTVSSLPYDVSKGKLHLYQDDYQEHKSPVASKEFQLSERPRTSKPDQFVKFTTSDPKSDGGQSTIPLIEAEEVVPSNLEPLSGMGLLYKATENSGSFVGIKLLQYNRWSHLNTE